MLFISWNYEEQHSVTDHYNQSYVIKPGGLCQIQPMSTEFHQDKSDKALLLYKYFNEEVEMYLHKTRVSLLSKKKNPSRQIF